MNNRHPSHCVDFPNTNNDSPEQTRNSKNYMFQEVPLGISIPAQTVSLMCPGASLNSKPKDLSFGLKPPISLVPPEFIREVSRCMEDGAKKRSAYNWRSSNVSAMQLCDKILRHVLDYIDGHDLTEDSKLSNLASAAADIAVLIDAKKYNTLVDDRPSKTDIR